MHKSWALTWTLARYQVVTKWMLRRLLEALASDLIPNIYNVHLDRPQSASTYFSHLLVSSHGDMRDRHGISHQAQRMAVTSHVRVARGLSFPWCVKSTRDVTTQPRLARSTIT